MKYVSAGSLFLSHEIYPKMKCQQEGSYNNLCNFLFLYYFHCRNSSVVMGASLSNSEYSLKVTDVTQVRTLNAIAKNILVQPDLSERHGYHQTKTEEQSTVLYDSFNLLWPGQSVFILSLIVPWRMFPRRKRT